jgi:hypothetical protein
MITCALSILSLLYAILRMRQGPMTRSRAATRRACGDGAASPGGGTHFAVSTTLAVLTTSSPAQSNIVDHLITEDK